MVLSCKTISSWEVSLQTERKQPKNLARMRTVLLSSMSSFNGRVISSHRLDRIGIAMGPQTWFNKFFGGNVTYSATVKNNKFSGAFGYAMAITSSRDFTVQGNTLFGNTSFNATRGPGCSPTDPTPKSQPFIIEPSTVTDSNIQSDFVTVQDANLLPCVIPPTGNLWPYGGGNPGPLSASNLLGSLSQPPPGNSSAGSNTSTSSVGPASSSPSGQSSSGTGSSTSAPESIPSSTSGQGSVGPSSSTSPVVSTPSAHHRPLGPGPAKHNSSTSSVPSIPSAHHWGPGPAKHNGSSTSCGRGA